MNPDTPELQILDAIKKHYLLTAGLLFAIYLAIFRGLGEAPLLQWDESRRGVNAIEMAEQGSWLVPYFEGKPDQWAAKPALLPALQRISMGLFGISEWALRLPVALFACGTIFLVWLFAFYLTGSAYMAYTSAFILLASPGYIHYHIAFTGDYGGLLIFFILATSFAFFVAVEDPGEKRRSTAWWAFGLALALGTLSKSIAAWLFTPALLIYLTIRNKWVPTLTDKRPYLAVFLALIIIAGYYLGRESIDPGYLQAVWDNELGGRYLQTLEGHDYPLSYYFEMFFDWKFLPWYLFVPFVFILKTNNLRFRHARWLLLSCSLVQILVVSNSSTKLSYYEAPVYPWMAILAGTGIFTLLSRFLAADITILKNKLDKHTAAFLMFLVIWSVPFALVFPHKKEQLTPIPETRIGGFTRVLKAYDNYFLCHHGYSAHDIFYVKKLQSEGKHVRLNAIDYLSPGDSLILCESQDWDRLEKWFTWELIHGQNRECALVRMVKKIKE